MPMKEWKYKPLQLMLAAGSRMPMWMLYGLSDVIFAVLYHIVGYRRKVALKHITDSFPEKSEREHRQICRQFYRNFADYIVETVKIGHISDSEIKRRMTFEGIEEIDRLMSEGKSIVAYFAHTFNWEWAPSITLWSSLKAGIDAEFCQVYRPLRNKWFDAYMLKIRSRFKPLSFPKSSVLRDLIRLRRDHMPSITGFMSDQKPSHGDPTRVLMFLNHPTAFITGTETLASKLGMAVVYWDMRKTSRGHYTIKMKLLTEDASKLQPMELTDQYAALLEETIRRDPANWLWTHKRWKKPVTLPANDLQNDTKQR